MSAGHPLSGRLRGGRHGLPREFVVRSQRDRILDAMARVTAQRGYAQTTVADVIAAAGVSRATFYQQFRDKHHCFLVALEVIVEQFLDVTVRSAGVAGLAWRQRTEVVLWAALRFMASEPHFARMALLEVLGAGDDAWERYRRAIRVMAVQLDEGRDVVDGAQALPPGTARAVVDGLVLAVRDEILAGRTEALPELAPDLLYSALVPFVGRDEALRARAAAGPAPHRPLEEVPRLEPPPEPSAKELRLMGALLTSLGQRGYTGTSVADITRIAAVSRTTFYECFVSREECFLRTHDYVIGRLHARVAGGYATTGDWPTRVHAGIEALVAAFAEHPALAHVLLRETFAVGPAAHARLRAAVRAFVPFLEDGRHELEGGEALPPTTARVALGAIAGTVIEELTQEQGPALADRLPQLAHAALVQFLGPEPLRDLPGTRGLAATTGSPEEGSPSGPAP